MRNPLDVMSGTCSPFASKDYRDRLKFGVDLKAKRQREMMGSLHARHRKEFSAGVQPCGNFDSLYADEFNAFPPECDCGAKLCLCCVCGKLHHANGCCKAQGDTR